MTIIMRLLARDLSGCPQFFCPLFPVPCIPVVFPRESLGMVCFIVRE